MSTALFDGHILLRARLNRAHATMKEADYEPYGSNLALGQAAFHTALTDANFVGNWADAVMTQAQSQLDAATKEGKVTPGGIIAIFIQLIEQYMPQIIAALIALFGGLIPVPTPPVPVPTPA